MTQYFVNYEGLLEKLMILCDDPHSFLKFPVSEDAAQLFGIVYLDLTPYHKIIKDMIWKDMPSLKLLEMRLVPSRLTVKRFNLILFLLIVDYLIPLGSCCNRDSISTQDTIASTFLEKSTFLQQERIRLNVSYEQALYLETSMA